MMLGYDPCPTAALTFLDPRYRYWHIRIGLLPGFPTSPLAALLSVFYPE